VRETGLTDKRAIRVRTASGVIEPRWLEDGRVEVDMGAPRLAAAEVPFDAAGLRPRLDGDALVYAVDVGGRPVEMAVVSMGNPHAVIDLAQFAAGEADPVSELGPRVERHPRFPQRVNAGFMQVLDPERIRLRVYERGAGETLACGTGACAAVVAGIRRGRLRAGVPVAVETRGGELAIAWAGGSADPVMMSGPAERVYEGEIELPDELND